MARLPAGQCLDPGGVRHAPAHIVKALGIGLLIGDEDDSLVCLRCGGTLLSSRVGGGSTLRVDQVQDQPGEVKDGDFFCGADVKDLAGGRGVLGEGQDGLHSILDVQEAAGLSPVPVHAQELIPQRLPDEAGDDHAVTAGLPGSDGVEQAEDHDGQAFFVVIGQRQELIHHFGGRVGPAAAAGRAQDHVVVLAEGDGVALAVDFGGGGDEHPGAVAQSGFEDRLGAHDIGLDGVHRALDDELHADRGGQVEDQAAFADQPVHDDLVGDGFDGEVETGIISQVGDVFEAPGGEVVDDGDAVAALEQGLSQVTADETGTPGDEDLSGEVGASRFFLSHRTYR